MSLRTLFRKPPSTLACQRSLQLSSEPVVVYQRTLNVTDHSAPDQHLSERSMSQITQPQYKIHLSERSMFTDHLTSANGLCNRSLGPSDRSTSANNPCYGSFGPRDRTSANGPRYRSLGSSLQIDIGKTARQTVRQTAVQLYTCLLYTSPSPRDSGISRMPSSA